MKTYVEAKPFVNNTNYEERRKQALIELASLLNSGSIDSPIVDIERALQHSPIALHYKVVGGISYMTSKWI